MRKLKHLLLILLLSVFMFAQYEIPIENLLTNSGFGVWSQSDANKGIAALIYDTGSAGGGDIPDVGDAVTGGASGATGKIMSMTIATGTFAGNNATGVIQLGSTTGCFNDDEALTFTDGETAVVNHPDGAVGADKIVKNGAFVHLVTPPNDWTATDCTLDTIVGGQVGNCLEMTRTGGAAQYATQDTTAMVAGKIYKVSVYVKSGTSGDEAFRLKDHGGTGYFTIDGTSIAAWVLHTTTFEATVSGYMQTQIVKNSATAGTMLFDEVTLYEITDGCTGANVNALDTWTKDSTLDIYRQHNDATYTKDGSFYALKMVVTTASDFVRWPGVFYNQKEWYMQFRGRTITIGAWIKTSTANHVFLLISETGVANTSSSYHTGGGGWEWIEVTRTLGAAGTGLSFQFRCTVAGNIDGTTIVYISQPLLCFGSSIGTGNYSPRQHEVVLLEKAIASNTLNNITSQSDLAIADLNVEADSSAMLGKGVKAVKILTQCNDSASAGTDCYLALRADATKGYEYYNSPYGLANDTDNRIFGWIQCDSAGDIDRYLNASGANTFDLDIFYYVAVKVTN